MFAVGHNFSVLMLSRVIGGMSAGMVMPGVTGLIADISPSHQKAKNFGYMSAIINSGFILGPVQRMAEVSHRMPFYFCRSIRYSSIYNVNCIDSRSEKVYDKWFPKVRATIANEN